MKCPNCGLANLETKPSIEFALTWPGEVGHCPICGATYVKYHGELQRYRAAEGVSNTIKEAVENMRKAEVKCVRCEKVLIDEDDIAAGKCYDCVVIDNDDEGEDGDGEGE